MKKYLAFPVILVLAFAILFSCSNKTETKKRAIVAIPADVTTYNPMFAFNTNEGNISELIYLSLAEYDWDADKGFLLADVSRRIGHGQAPDSGVQRISLPHQWCPLK